MAIIQLTRGFETKVDDQDMEQLEEHKWCVMGPTNGGYYAVSRIKNKLVSMSRLLMNARKGDYVDHINGDTLDNRRNNLRLVRNGTNIRNGKLAKNNKSGVTGVCWMKGRNHFVVTADIWGQQFYVGHAHSAEEGLQMRKAFLQRKLGKNYETQIYPKQYGN